MARDGFFDEEEIEEAFNSPQARYVSNRLAAARAAKLKEERELERKRQESRVHPAAAANIGAEFAAVAKGEVPMHRPLPPEPFRANYTPNKKADPPRPGQTGAISGTLALAAIVSEVKASPDPRAEAARWLTIITTELVAAADEADPLDD